MRNYIRFHFAKKDETLKEAIDRLSHLREKVANAGEVDWR